MTICSIKLCGKSSANSSSKTDGITFHRFPKDGKVRKKWVIACDRDESWSPTHNSVVCSRHFTENCFHIVGVTHRRRINSTAVPTLFLPNEASAPVEDENHSDQIKTDAQYPQVPSLLLTDLESCPITAMTRCSSNELSRNGSESQDSDYSPETSNDTAHKKLSSRISDLTKIVEVKKKLLRQSRDHARRLETKLETLKLEVEELRKQSGISSKNSNNKAIINQHTLSTAGSVKHELNNIETDEHNDITRGSSTERALRRKITDLTRKLNQSKLVNKHVRSSNTSLRKTVKTLKMLIKKFKSKGLLTRENVSIERLKSLNKALVEKVATLKRQLIKEKRKNRGVQRNVVWCKPDGGVDGGSDDDHLTED